MRQIKITEAASLLQGIIEGSDQATFNFVSKIDQSIPGSLTFLANPIYEEHVYNNNASVIIVPSNFEAKQKIEASLIKMDNPYLGFCTILNHYFNPYQAKIGIEEGAYVSDGSQLGEDVYVGKNSYISEDCKIGDRVKIFPNSFIGQNVSIDDDSVIYPGVNIYYDSVIGKNVILHSGVVVGSDGFGHAPKSDGSYVKIPQIGNVVIGDWVEIGANSTIDRATMGSTVIEEGVRIDNLVQVAHNVTIKKHTVIAAQTGISGSTSLGAYSQVGGQAGIAGHLKVADKTTIAAKTGVISSIDDEGTTVAGFPSQPIRGFFKSKAYVRRIPKTETKIKELEELVKELQKQLKNK